MKNILVPTDFSEDADNALSFAIAIAGKMKAKITLMHAFDIQYSSAAVPPMLIQEEISSKKKESDKTLRKMMLRATEAGVACRILSVRGLATESILNAAEDEKADLIVMGTRGAGRLRPAIFGTNTTAVMESASCPVFTVPENSRFNDLKNIVVATDYDDKDLVLLKQLLSMFRYFNTHFALLHVALPDEINSLENMEIFTQKAREQTGMENISHTVLPTGNAEEAIKTFLTQRSADLLVVSPHRHNFLKNLFGNNITRKLAFHIKTPLLSVHEE